MKVGIIIAILAGLVLTVMLIAYRGLAEISGMLFVAGWGLILVALLHLIPAVLSSLAWRSLISATGRNPFRVFLLARLVREGASHLLPVAQVGAELVGARVLTLHGTQANVAGASVVVDLFMEVLSQVMFTLLGLLLLVLAGVHNRTVFWMFIGLAAMLAVLGGFILAQRSGMFKVLEHLMEKLAAKWPWISLGAVDGLHEAIQTICRNRRALLAAGGLHMTAWLLGAAEVWLAVSLAKRLRDLLLGVPALLYWQYLEGRKVWIERTRESIKANVPSSRL